METQSNKKAFVVKCNVNMCANHTETVVVKTTKPHLAVQLAEAELRNNGFFHAKAFNCKEME